MRKICPTELSLGDVEASVWSFSCSRNVSNHETYETTKLRNSKKNHKTY